MVKIIYTREYNESPENNRLVRGLKSNNLDAIYQMAKDMRHQIKSNAILIPIPSRSGHAEGTKTLCNLLAKYTGCTVRDILKGKKRESTYEAKKQGKVLNSEQFGFNLIGGIPNGDVYLIDNIIATGNTFKYILRLIPGAKIFVHSMDFRHLAQLGENLRSLREISIEKSNLLN